MWNLVYGIQSRLRVHLGRSGHSQDNTKKLGKTPNIATEFAEIAEIAMVFLKIAKIAISLRKKNNNTLKCI